MNPARHLPYPWIAAGLAILVNGNTLRNGLPVLDDPSRLVSFADTALPPAGAGLFSPDVPISRLAARALESTGAGFQVWNLAAHAAVTILVFQTGAAVLGSRTLAFIAAVLFAIHPVHTDALNRASGSPEIFAALFSLAALAAAVRPNRGRVAAAAAAALTLAALLETGAAAVLPVLVLLLLAHTQRTGSLRERLRAALSHPALPAAAAVAAIYIALRLWTSVAAVQPHYVHNPLVAEGLGVRLMTAVHILAQSLGLLIWPYRLLADYSFATIAPVTTMFSRPFLLPAAALLVVVALAVYRVRSSSVYLFGYAFLLTAFVPYSSVFRATPAIAAERYLYLCSVAFCWMLAELAHDAGWVLSRPPAGARGPFASPRALVLVLVSLLLPWGAKSYLRNAQWRQDRLLLEATVRGAPRNARAQFMLGALEYRDRNAPAAERRFRRALDVYPGYAAASLGLAASLNTSGRSAEAVAVLTSVAPAGADLERERLKQLGAAYVGLNDFPAASRAYASSIAIGDDDAEVHRTLGILYLKFLEDPERGRAHLRRSLEIAPDQPRAGDLRALLAGRADSETR